MPEIIVTSRLRHDRDSTVLHQERVCARDLESDHFAAQLVERLGWALTDAEQAEHGEADGRPPAAANAPPAADAVASPRS